VSAVSVGWSQTLAELAESLSNGLHFTTNEAIQQTLKNVKFDTHWFSTIGLGLILAKA
jgi:hypothetical protein